MRGQGPGRFVECTVDNDRIAVAVQGAAEAVEAVHRVVEHEVLRQVEDTTFTVAARVTHSADQVVPISGGADVLTDELGLDAVAAAVRLPVQRIVGGHTVAVEAEEGITLVGDRAEGTLGLVLGREGHLDAAAPVTQRADRSGISVRSAHDGDVAGGRVVEQPNVFVILVVAVAAQGDRGVVLVADDHVDQLAAQRVVESEGGQARLDVHAQVTNAGGTRDVLQ